MPKITDTEWQIMRVVWARNPITASEIVQQLTADDPTWHPKTARTLLNRLVQKGALSYAAQGRAYLYAPLFSQKECVTTASESFLERVFGGSLKPMLVHFVDQRRLTKEDLDDLRSLLKTSDRKAGKKREGNQKK